MPGACAFGLIFEVGVGPQRDRFHPAPGSPRPSLRGALFRNVSILLATLQEFMRSPQVDGIVPGIPTVSQRLIQSAYEI